MKKSLISLWKLINKNKLLAVFLLLVLPVLGEFKFSPFGTDFRFAVSSIAFMMVLLLAPDLPKVLTGLIVGITMVIFRVNLDIIGSDLDFLAALVKHYPAGIYYLALAFWLNLVNINQKLYRPLLPVMLTILGDVGSNLVELIFRYQTIFALEIYSKVPMLTAVASLRVVWIYGIINIVQLQKLKDLRKQEQEQFHEMLLFVSSLHCEAFFLRKTLLEMEQITAKSYKLYQQLQVREIFKAELDKIALNIATEVHEVKKDSQRILAGISKLIELEKLDTRMTFEDVLLLVVKSNQNYAGSLKKEIKFRVNAVPKILVSHIYSLLAILNNLVTNAVEASYDTGLITIAVFTGGENLNITISDKGSGIAEQDLELIFHPGYTTKFNDQGISSTGIGLTHVKELVTNLGGTITVESAVKQGTCFTLTIPKEKIVEE